MEGYVQGEGKVLKSAPKLLSLEIVVSKQQFEEILAPQLKKEGNRVELKSKPYNRRELKEFDRQYKEWQEENKEEE
jgi:hypothetical protein